MQNYPLIFTAETAEDTFYLIFGLVIAVAGIGSAIYFMRRPSTAGNRNMTMVVAMLLFFIGMIGAGTAVFSALTLRRLQPVVLTRETLTTGYGEVSLREINTAQIVEDRQVSLVNPSMTTRSTRLLLIEERSGKVHALSEKHYDINRILGSMREVVRNASADPQ